MNIRYFENEQIFMLQTKSSTYAFSVQDGVLSHLYWGATVTDACDLPKIDDLTRRYTVPREPRDDFQEYRGWGGVSFIEPDLKVRFSSGARNLFLRYVSHIIEGDTLKILLRDTSYAIEVELKYTVRYGHDMIERSSRIINHTSDDIMIEKAFSATWQLPHRDDYRLTYFSGAWSCEYRKKQETIQNTQRVLETRGGLSGPEAIPFFMIDEKGEAREDKGDVYFGSLIWSGNWKMIINKDKANRVFITAGVNDFDFEWCLEPEGEFETPIFVAGYTTGGFGNVSRTIHSYEREIIMHPVERDRLMPVAYNAYGTYYHKINEERILSVLDKAHELGIELFIMDAGWQGKGDVEDEGFRRGFGTWEVNYDRFPNGLKPIADKVHSYGMMYGLWMEPEAVHRDSEICLEHPEWILKYDGREAEYDPTRPMFTLNLALDEVCEYITNKIISLVREYDIDYFKMDFNRFITHMGWQGADGKHAKEVWVRYVRNLYKCYNRVKAEFPNLMIENCAAGGMRMDMGMLAFSGRINRSDNQDTLDILKLHEGFSHFILPKLAGGGCHISDVYSRHHNGRVSPMKFQAHAAMLGSMAIGKDISKLEGEEREELIGYIKEYKAIRHIVGLGDIYRLVSPLEKSYAVFEYISKDKKEILVFLLGQSMQFMQVPERLRLRGLEKDKKYEVENYGIFTGNGLMTVGLPIYIRGDMQSELIKIRLIERI